MRCFACFSNVAIAFALIVALGFSCSVMWSSLLSSTSQSGSSSLNKSETSFLLSSTELLAKGLQSSSSSSERSALEISCFLADPEEFEFLRS